MAEDKIISEDTGSTVEEQQVSFLASVINEIIYSPLNLVLVGVITFLIYKIFRSRQQPAAAPPPEPELPRIRKDMTVDELLQYDGTQADGRVLVAVNGNVYDVTKGKRFYGPGGPYAAFGGRDASRCLATFSVTSSDKVEYDDLSDLTPMEMESVREWEMQFKEKYILVGRLLKPGEQPTNYSDEDEDTPNEATPTPEPEAAPNKAPSSPKVESKPSDSTSKVEDIQSGGDAKAKDEWRLTRNNNNNNNRISNNNNYNTTNNSNKNSSASILQSDVEDSSSSSSISSKNRPRRRHGGDREDIKMPGDCKDAGKEKAQQYTAAYDDQANNENNDEDEDIDARGRPFDQHSICDMFGF